MKNLWKRYCGWTKLNFGNFLTFILTYSTPYQGLTSGIRKCQRSRSMRVWREPHHTPRYSGSLRPKPTIMPHSVFCKLKNKSASTVSAGKSYSPEVLKSATSDIARALLHYSVPLGSPQTILIWSAVWRQYRGANNSRLLIRYCLVRGKWLAS